ncbi:VWA domain-containing protein [uncultured Mesotoga sp.]|uniref:vWA domain-containing protein n=2 Tax=Mesotoga TaxID=1184396 RepID=UPI002598CCC8|nr:VWA domain-containing protein [uncultured Mesotoga sp.]
MPLPGGELASRPLYFFWICDCSGSMSGEKIQSLNMAIRESIPEMRQVADDNPSGQLLVRVLEFSSGARWKNTQPIPIENFTWTDLSASGVTDMGRAFSMVADQLKIPPMPGRALPPVLVLVTDGQPTDDYKSGLNQILNLQWGKKAVRIAIGIGQDCDFDVLEEFIGNSEIKPLHANNPEALARYIKWASTAVVKDVSSPASGLTGQGTATVQIGQIPAASTDADVW